MYLALQDISNKRGCTKHDLLYGLELTEFNEAKLVDSEILNKFKGIFSDLAQKVFESVSAGRGIVGVSLPVRIFEPRSLLERACDSWAFAPIYLNQAVTT